LKAGRDARCREMEIRVPCGYLVCQNTVQMSFVKKRLFVKVNASFQY
jgi:hypothetical protein